MRILACIQTFNEADIIGYTLDHLLAQGIEPFVLDNWSTDNTVEVVHAKGVTCQRWPEKPDPCWSLSTHLFHVAELARRTKADWFIHQDADEIRRSPVPGETLAQGIERVARMGFTAINHQCYTFRPIDNGYAGDPEAYFRYYTGNAHEADRIQIKAWANCGPVRLACGGHIVDFSGRSICPQMFALKHYPVRSQEHGERKVFRERKPRWSTAERILGWHVHYDHMRIGHNFLFEPSALKVWDTPADVMPAPISPFSDLELWRVVRMAAQCAGA